MSSAFSFILISALVNSDFVLGVDCDGAALAQAVANVRDLEMEDRVSLILAKVQGSPRGGGSETRPELCGGRVGGRGRGGAKGGRRGRGRGGNRSPQRPPAIAVPTNVSAGVYDESNVFSLSDDCVDTVVTNPPFGTKPDKAGIDMQFLKLSCRLARRAVYSLHKSSTRDFILRTMNALPKVSSAIVIAEMKFDLPQKYKFHQQASVDIAVDLIRIELVCLDATHG